MQLNLLETPTSVYNFANKFNSVPEKKDYSKMSEEELLAELRGVVGFEKLVFPNEWYGKYELPLKECLNMKEYLREAPWLKSFQHNYIGKQDIPAKPGGNRPILPAPEVPAVVVIQNSFSDGESTSQTVASNPEETQQSSVCSTEANDSTLQA